MLAKLKKMTRKEIEDSFDISGKKGKEGTTFRAGQYAVKLFKTSKSAIKLKGEAELQSAAAAKGVAPAVHYVSTAQKLIVMDALEETIVDKGKREKWSRLPEAYAAQLYALCKRLDAAGLVQNDGNPLNLMLDANGRLYIIDYGFAKKITAAVKKKRGSQPNVNLTLWHFARQMRHYTNENKVKFLENDLTERIVNKYMKDNSFVDQALLDEGERLLGPIGAQSVAVVKASPAKKRKPVVTKAAVARKKKPLASPAVPEEFPFKSGDLVYWAKTAQKRYKVTVKSQTTLNEVTITYKTSSGSTKTKVVDPNSLELKSRNKTPQKTVAAKETPKKPVAAKENPTVVPPAPRKKRPKATTPPRKSRKRLKDKDNQPQFHQHVERPMTLEERINARRKGKSK